MKEISEPAESEDKQIMKEIAEFIYNSVFKPKDMKKKEKWLTWFENQDKHSIYNVPSREVILAIWDLGNEWKELTNGCISTKYGTQLNYIQKHWEESEYYLREKQGKETSWKPSKEEMDVLYGLAYITNQYDEHKEEIITRLYQNLKREFFNGSSYENMFHDTEDDVRRRSTIQVLEYARSLDNYNQYGKADIDKNIAWLEKQGEQFDDNIINSSDERIRKAILEGLIDCRDAPDLGWSNFGGIEIEDCIAWLEEQGKKPQGKSALEAIKEEKVDNANKIEPKDYSSIDPYFSKPIGKVEPKFKDGDWITNGEYTWKVISVDYLDYTLQNQWGECVEDTVDYVNKAFHLWTIQDAKDGDILFSRSPFIYGKQCPYGGISWYNNKFSKVSNFIFTDSPVHPATKEQRDFLFQKMKEAGYEWIADKKELKKEEVK